MPHRTVSWTRIDRVGRDNRPTIPAGVLGARALIQFSARTRPLATAGRYDRAAIMAAARRCPLLSRPLGRSPRLPTAPPLTDPLTASR
jgi:hypothetical protein